MFTYRRVRDATTDRGSGINVKIIDQGYTVRRMVFCYLF